MASALFVSPFPGSLPSIHVMSGPYMQAPAVHACSARTIHAGSSRPCMFCPDHTCMLQPSMHVLPGPYMHAPALHACSAWTNMQAPALHACPGLHAYHGRSHGHNHWTRCALSSLRAQRQMTCSGGARCPLLPSQQCGGKWCMTVQAAYFGARAGLAG